MNTFQHVTVSYLCVKANRATLCRSIAIATVHSSVFSDWACMMYHAANLRGSAFEIRVRRDSKLNKVQVQCVYKTKTIWLLFRDLLNNESKGE